ncbi:hypothetical protein HPP92_012031 [Vanilla planifolia]|uniref:Protein kinase domain-containing protein n=1 Tax=Vanilla planifolia TaxID=51239 RepID=A0A835R796_VANPL|nr:hypothetical protein HPP92_012031 [Vanilla planifolia]
MHARSWVRGGCIGKGSFGEVSLAVDRTDGRVFAVKTIDLNSAPLLAVAALENEIRILRSIDSPYVVSYLGDDVTESGRRRNLHLEYLGGGTLAAAAFSAKLLERDVRVYARSITRALQYLHSSAGLVHGDVKGRNVLLCSESGVGKLADFGSARRISADAGTAGAAGTPLWMAPEVARGEAATAASDVWSLGCTVIEMAGGGRPPWGELGPDVDAAAQMFRIGFTSSLPEFPSQMSKTAQDFLDKCLQRDPAKRWTCEQLLHHPFLTEPTAEIGPSPRSVQDWANLDPEVDDDDDLECRGSEDASLASTRRRLRLLASESSSFSANWTLDGWVEVAGRWLRAGRGLGAGRRSLERLVRPARVGAVTKPGRALAVCSLRARRDFGVRVGLAGSTRSGSAAFARTAAVGGRSG